MCKKKGKDKAFPGSLFDHGPVALLGGCELFSQVSFGSLGQLAKRGHIFKRQMGQQLAVDFDAGAAQTIHQSAVRNTTNSGARIDANDPQRAELALFLAAIAVGVLAGFGYRLLGNAKHLAPRPRITLGFFKNFLVARTSGDAAFYSGHF